MTPECEEFAAFAFGAGIIFGVLAFVIVFIVVAGNVM